MERDPAKIWTRPEVRVSVGKMIVESLGVDEVKVTDDAALVRDLGAESIDFLDMSFKCQQIFGVDLPMRLIQDRRIEWRDLTVLAKVIEARYGVRVPAEELRTVTPATAAAVLDHAAAKHGVRPAGGDERAIVLRFAQAGAHVFVGFFVNREAAEKTARDVELRGGTAQLLQADLKEPGEIRQLVAAVERRAGRLDVLVSNAASGVLRSGLELSPKQWDWVLATNARALLVLAQEASRLMRAGGRIIALSSLGSQRVIPGYAAIGVSKAALEALTRYLAAELPPRGTTVKTVSAGAGGPDGWQAMPDGGAALAAIRAGTPGGALVPPVAAAEVVSCLARP